MKLLLYGMQSSGASTVAFLCAQKPECVAFVDVWNMFGAPRIETHSDVVAKVVVTTTHPLREHRERFRPDITFLVLRHPVDTYNSLNAKHYSNQKGSPNEKLAVVDDVFTNRSEFDAIIYYEDLVFSPNTVIDRLKEIGWDLPEDALLFPRTEQQIQDTNHATAPGLDDHVMYGMGNFQLGSLRRDRVVFAEISDTNAHLRSICPALLQHYSHLCAERAEWHVPGPALLSFRLNPVIRALAEQRILADGPNARGYALHLSQHPNHHRFAESALSIRPSASKQETHIRVSGLPGRPFNRIAGASYIEDPRGLGSGARIIVEDLVTGASTEQVITLRRAEMRSIDLPFRAEGPIVLSLCVGTPKNMETPLYGSVCFADLRLECAPNVNLGTNN